MGILAHLIDKSNQDFISRANNFFDRFIPSEVLKKCGVMKIADFSKKIPMKG